MALIRYVSLWVSCYATCPFTRLVRCREDATRSFLPVAILAQLVRQPYCLASSSDMTSHELELEVAALKKRKLELSAELRRKSDAIAKAAHSGQAQQQSLASLVLDVGVQSFAEPTTVVSIPPQLAAHKMKAKLLALFELSGHSAELVASWLLGHGRGVLGSDHCDPENVKLTVAGVEWLYIRTPDHELATALDSVSAKHLLQLGRYVVEHHLFQWLVKQNCEQGVAPKSYQLLTEAVTSVPFAMHAGAQAKLCDLFQQPRRVTWLWLASFRERWDVKEGMLTPGETLDPKLMEDKVAWLA